MNISDRISPQLHQYGGQELSESIGGKSRGIASGTDETESTSNERAVEKQEARGPRKTMHDNGINPDQEEKQPDTAPMRDNFGNHEMSNDDLRIVRELASRDREVRAHEQAHSASGGQYVTSGPSYEFQIGPDGIHYAVAGEVGIDTSPIPDSPEATIQKMRQVKRAALAPSEPSAQDRAAAAAAGRKEADAARELRKEDAEAIEEQNTLKQNEDGRNQEKVRTEESDTGPKKISNDRGSGINVFA